MCTNQSIQERRLKKLVARKKSKRGAVVKHQKIFVVLEATSNVKGLFKSSAASLSTTL